MINFTVGPVQTEEYICEIGAEQIPYFRTREFSDTMKENERLLLDILNAPEESRAVFLTGSGTAAMEAVVMNALNEDDRALIINGGSFGARFSQLCDMHHIPHYDILLNPGESLKRDSIDEREAELCSVLLVNMHETSTGVLYDMNLIKEICDRYNLFLVVDAISSFLVDSLDMSKLGIDVAIMSSQKALACPPGISIVAMNNTAIRRIMMNKTKCMYLDLKDALINGERGQTPFTPAVGILRQIHARLLYIMEHGGAENEVRRVKELADDFRERVSVLPFSILAENRSNGVTALQTDKGNARLIFETLKNEYEIWICPNGGDLAKRVFRVGHIGHLTNEDNIVLVDAMKDMQARGII